MISRRLSIIVVASLVLQTLLPVKVAQARAFKNCAEVRKNHPNGIAINFRVIGFSGAEINRQIYLRNQRLDRDRDGLICEDEWAQSVGSGTIPTTTTTQPVTLRTPISDLSAFARTFGSAMTTIECRAYGNVSTGSGTSVSINFTSSAAIEKGIRSGLVTNHHVVEDCLVGNWLERQVLVRHGSIECFGYVWDWDSDKDLASVYTTCDIPKVSGFVGLTVPRPSIGDVAVIIGSAAGIAGTSTVGAIANITNNEILTTAQAAPGSSGGALFNRNGQLLGIVQGATGTLTIVIPITKFPGAIYADSVQVDWR